MALTGTLRTWHDDRGFGFIAPRDGGREVFVHISAFPRDGSRPTVGETLMYELGTGANGKPQAVRVVRQALGRPGEYPAAKRRADRRRFPLLALIGVLIVAALGAYGLRAYQHRAALMRPTEPPRITAPVPTAPSPTPDTAASRFRCDGRTRCSQMTSCAEATYFLKNCPGAAMDGNHDGVPCEQQWCTGPLAK